MAATVLHTLRADQIEAIHGAIVSAGGEDLLTEKYATATVVLAARTLSPPIHLGPDEATRVTDAVLALPDRIGTPEHRIEQAAAIAARYGLTDGAHHKQWVIDQMLRAILEPDDYAAFCDWFSKVDDDGEHLTDAWDTGVAP